jgi:hypothetical protein
MRPRFRLRTLLFLTALVAAGCYWWIARPTIVAQRFAAAVNDGDFDSAAAMCDDVGKWRRLVKSMWYHPYLSSAFLWPNHLAERPRESMVRQEVELLPRTWADLRQGQRRVLQQTVWSGPDLIPIGSNDPPAAARFVLRVNSRHVIIRP